MTSVPKDSADKKDARMELRIPDALMGTLLKIQERHSISPQDVARRCLDQVAEFFQQNGYFSFPVHIVPDAEFLRMVRETTPFGQGVVPAGLKEGPAHSKTPPKKKTA